LETEKIGKIGTAVSIVHFFGSCRSAEEVLHLDP